MSASFICALEELYLAWDSEDGHVLCWAVAALAARLFSSPCCIQFQFQLQCCFLCGTTALPLSSATWFFHGAGRMAWQLMVRVGPSLAPPKTEQNQPGPLAMVGIQRQQNLSWSTAQAEPAGLHSRAGPAQPVSSYLCKGQKQESFSQGLFIFKRVFREAYSAFLSGLTGCQYSKLDSWLVLLSVEAAFSSPHR